MQIVTLLTDFGLEDEYVGVMKGAILSVNPSAKIVDISHAVNPQEIVQAALMLEAAWPYFPPCTVHVAVVDPGVGSRRSIVAVRKSGHIFLAPDNGVLTLVLSKGDIDEAVRVENTRFFLKPVSGTFHGRDVFAPVSGRLASGRRLQDFGPPIDYRRLNSISLPEVKQTRKEELSGSILTADRFGNLITNIRLSDIEKLKGNREGKVLEIRLGKERIVGIGRCYSEVTSGEPVAVIGSRLYLEIAINCGNALKHFGVKKGDPVQVVLRNV
ncbi:MAG: hypothetical protein C4530_03975 [Desulfobacteraceae bacterium]|nr:MAG: hypothetical protein C4530_03975 [Desulfobacteraceae bacterium]